ncbi:hypothetical protein AAG607_12880 [Citromicrobium bathyomarinum]|uniref:hypothetical protein n=1 Tax=Alphaproteobacteria TaxID=28211 RepID=UPI000C0CF292|nr:hypothetical protein [Henriciella sp.]MBO81988.1 hypothetical protein [Citromicrobium sp.]PHR70069.1 MAG: hypothetical protein COA64_16280 [Henriciella sp.]|tara:strand:+ start:14112 stop:14849 length:738 start_codon:yes stop_codon:yes gene_type:complete
MFIAVDGISSELPGDVYQLGTSIIYSETVDSQGGHWGVDDRGGDGAEYAGMVGYAGMTVPTENLFPVRQEDAPQDKRITITVDHLDRWDVQSHQYTSKAEVEGSLLGRLFSSKAESATHGIVQEAKRFCAIPTAEGRTMQVGTAVRIAVIITSGEIKTTLTLPNVAASAQISDLRAKIAMSVHGYTGPLGEILPVPSNLNVENLASYTNAFTEIQNLVFGADGLHYIRPTLLGYEEKSPPSAEPK